ncbi:Zn(2)-C6 fungal-type domain-containing protein [Mycena kentingensis (nom. inval.)]|nr:Zn(2)-C6 fungal-type domain-containing protein [Mycena kentingensis (nom. inval.)]
MANPRQRRKARSGTHRAMSHSLHAKRKLKKMPPIRGPASALLNGGLWDKSKTVKQNPLLAWTTVSSSVLMYCFSSYAALGLAHTLNPSAAGGVEPTEQRPHIDGGPATSSIPTKLPKGHGRIVRDADGNVVAIEIPEEEQESDQLKENNMTDAEKRWIGSHTNASSGIVPVLERLVSGAIPAAGPRHPSQLEVAYLERLADKHGSDVGRMARDRKLNPEQPLPIKTTHLFIRPQHLKCPPARQRRPPTLPATHRLAVYPLLTDGRLANPSLVCPHYSPQCYFLTVAFQRDNNTRLAERAACAGASTLLHLQRNHLTSSRVRCDLKDLPRCQRAASCLLKLPGTRDEFAELKQVTLFATRNPTDQHAAQVKLLRRGRRLQQVEQIYGKGAGDDASSISLPPTTRLPSIKPEFFSSPFWSWFSSQRPILDPTELPARLIAQSKGTHSLGNEGKILLHLLVVWAASFGIDERGLPANEDSSRPSSASTAEDRALASRPGAAKTGIELVSERARAERKSRIEGMVQEILLLIDSHAIMRRPTWDGIRVLLLILPLMEDISISPLDRRCMYEATLNQAAACTLSGGPSLSTHSFPHASDDSIVRARILWYAYMHEGITTGMRGGRFILNDDDIQSFQSTIPAFGFNLNTNSPVPSPVSPSFPPSSIPHRLIHPQSSHPQLSSALHAYMTTAESFAIPLQLSAVCRRVYVVLTGSHAARRAQDGSGLDAEGMRAIWDGLEHCWDELEALRHRGDLAEDFHMFITGWQIYIFECHNIIRETLKQYSMQGADSTLFPAANSPHPTVRGATHLPPHQLHAIASRKCLRLLPAVLALMRTHFAHGPSRLFAWDAGLVRDGCFFAGFLCATIDNDAPEFAVENREFMHLDMEGVRSSIDTDEGIRLSLAVLKEMTWAFSKSEEREDTVRRIWEDKKKRKLEQQQQHAAHHGMASYGDMEYHAPPSGHATPYPDGSPYPPFAPKWISDADAHNAHNIPMLLGDRPILPPLSLLGHDASPRSGPHDSAPSTGYSVDGAGARGSGWPTYTPPGTATSGTSTSTGVSSSGSPSFPGSLPNSAGPDITHFKTEADATNPFFGVTRDLDHFSFNPITVSDGTECSPHYSPTGFLGGGVGVFDHAAAVLTQHEHPHDENAPQAFSAEALYH